MRAFHIAHSRGSGVIFNIGDDDGDSYGPGKY